MHLFLVISLAVCLCLAFGSQGLALDTVGLSVSLELECLGLTLDRLAKASVSPSRLGLEPNASVLAWRASCTSLLVSMFFVVYPYINSSFVI